MLSSKILSIGYDHELMRLRGLLIRQTLGVEVRMAFDVGSALARARSEDKLDVVLLCYTVPAADQALILAAIEARHGKIPVLSIYPAMCSQGIAGTPVSNDPEDLLEALKEALDLRDQSAAD
jgi:DNA-binding NtrC family response regulator